MSAELLFPKGKEDGILLAKFSNAQLENDDGMRFGLFEDTAPNANKRKRKRQMVAETDKMTYVGKNYGSYAAAENNFAKYFVGVLDKKTNKIKVYNSEIFLLHPHLSDEKDGEDEVDVGDTYRAKLDALTEAFGVGKKKRAMNKRKQVQLDSKAMDTAMQSAVTLAMKEPTASMEPEPQEEAEGTIIPPHHKDATKPQEAYLLEDLISAEEMEALKTPAQIFANSSQNELQELTEAHKISSLVLAQMKFLPVNPEARLRKACILTYVQYLVNFFLLRAADVKKRDFLPEDVPGLIKKKLTNEFCVMTRQRGKPSRCMPTKMKDKIMMHILVLGLILDDFNFEFSQLLVDLKVSHTRVAKTLKALGCTAKIQKLSQPGEDELLVRIATVPIPLKFPELSTPRKSRPN